MLVSYFEAGRMCDYIQQHWGSRSYWIWCSSSQFRAARRMLSGRPGYGAGGLRQAVPGLALPGQRGARGGFDGWHKQLEALVTAARARHDDEVLANAEAVIALYPDYVYDGNAYQLLAEAALSAGKAPLALSALTRYVEHRGRDPAALEQLAKLQQEAGNRPAAIATLQKINLIDPLFDTDSHRRLGDLLMDDKQFSAARREFGAVLALHPLDKAQANYDLARACHAAGDADCAMNAVLAALEVAPDFRPAQKLLLELTGQ